MSKFVPSHMRWRAIRGCNTAGDSHKYVRVGFNDRYPGSLNSHSISLRLVLCIKAKTKKANG